ncbi:MAG: hypothetical protein ABJE95_29800 [Byssovorax sp.]
MDETSTPDEAKKSDEAPHEIVVANEVAERVDAEGLPLDRPPTLDDVRGTEGGGRMIAVGCTVLVVLAALGFWILRAAMMH